MLGRLPLRQCAFNSFRQSAPESLLAGYLSLRAMKMDIRVLFIGKQCPIIGASIRMTESL